MQGQELNNWEKRTIAEEPRLSEITDFYKELGFEVMLKDLGPEELSPELCSTCMMENPERYKVIYTLKTTE